MFKSAVFAVLVASVLGKTTWRDLDGYTFEKFMTEFNLDYREGTTEYAQRKILFEKELARVTTRNKAKTTWKETINHMSALTASEKKAFAGRHKGVAAAHKPAFKSVKGKSQYGMKKVDELPTDVDWRNQGVVSAVKDQGGCGSCWAFAATAVYESQVAINSGLLFDLSPQQIAACTPNPDECGGSGNCKGATAELAFDYLAGSNGIVQEFTYGYSEYFGRESDCAIPDGAVPKATSTGYTKLEENNYEELMNAVATVGPIAVSVDASNWGAYDSGIFDGCNQAKPDIDHAVVLVGYGEDNGQKYWLIRNSWSASWGEAGYIRLARSDSEASKCGTDTTPCDGSSCAGTCDQPVNVCGTCGVLYDSSYPTGVTLV